MLCLRRSAMSRRPLTQAGHDLVIQIADDQLRHAINDSTAGMRDGIAVLERLFPRESNQAVALELL